ncbi:MAG: S9 family peptidase [Planctomycetes bacterium]|nr:S9 family peptidase [Planctomycetota bacterium]MBI3833097.1 S9 family peptidase [Planctomycetota bacterium]
MKNFAALTLVAASSLAWEATSSAELPPLIPREVFFGNPDKASPQISPDGKRLAYLAADQGVLNVWVRTVGQSDDKAITKDRKRGIRRYFWAPNNEQIIYIQDKDGDENWHVYSVNVASLEERDLTPFENVQARIEAVDQKFPNEILLAINKRNPQLHDVYRADLNTGALAPEILNDEGFIGWTADNDLHIRAGTKMLPEGNGGTQLYVRDRIDAPWKPLTKWEPEDALTSGPVAFAPDGKGLFIISSSASNAGELREVSAGDGKERKIASDDQADVADVLIHPKTHVIQAVAFNKDRKVWKVIDQSIADDFAALGKVRDGDFDIINRDHADQTWLVSFEMDDGPIYFYAFDRKTRKGELLFSNRKALENLKLAKMKPIQFTARDGLAIHAYLTLPPGVDAKDLPMVLNVHGGPWARDMWGYDGEVQWMANRGYAVLQVNYRGSTGYGKKFINAGDREWGGKIHNDLVDAVNWVVKEGIADPKRIGIFGGSFGGYSTLVGLTFTPDLFACGVDIVGPSNLITFQETIPPYWKPLESILWQRVGHPQKDAEFLKSRSPLFKVDQIKKPLLVAQGANDPRVKKTESLQMVDALKKAGRDVEYMEYSDEGHGFARPENRLDFFSHAENFLAKYLGGRMQDTSKVEPKAADRG